MTENTNITLNLSRLKQKCCGSLYVVQRKEDDFLELLGLHFNEVDCKALSNFIFLLNKVTNSS